MLENKTRREIEVLGQKGATKKDLAKVLNSFYLYVDKNEQSVGQWLANLGYWEAWITSWMTRVIPKSGTCIDIGSNFGYYSRLMEVLVGENGTVHSIEANPQLLNQHRNSVLEFPSQCHNTFFHPFAISNQNGSATFSIPNEVGGASLVYNHKNAQYIEVETKRLDDIITDQHIDLIKIDIEGAEHLCWEGMQQVLKRTDRVIMEHGSGAPNWFVDQIFDQCHVTYVNFLGLESEITKQQLLENKQLLMLVLTPL